MTKKGPQPKYKTSCVRKSVSLPTHSWNALDADAIHNDVSTSELIRAKLGIGEIRTIPKGTKLDAPKTCRCGLTYKKLPFDGKLNVSGLWFQCECDSTLLVPFESE